MVVGGMVRRSVVRMAIGDDGIAKNRVLVRYVCCFLLTIETVI